MTWEEEQLEERIQALEDRTDDLQYERGRLERRIEDLESLCSRLEDRIREILE